jgi:hypothetical protein
MEYAGNSFVNKNRVIQLKSENGSVFKPCLNADQQFSIELAQIEPTGENYD